MRASTFRFLKNSALLLWLFAPSAWMIATIPPLWRDADAYVQVTEDPLIATFWSHAPAYCYIVKVPLFAGEQFERLRGNAPSSRGTDSSQPGLTDSGISLLIIGQHLALCGAAFYFIIAVTHFFWIRLGLALAWASNALFYTFAHCVGSETLGLILIVLLAGKALRLVQSRREPRWVDWYVFALILCFCLLSRHLNLALISLLPAAFLFSSAQNRMSLLFASGDKRRLWLRRLTARDLRQAVIAIAIGIACVTIANFATQSLARKSKAHPHSRIGFAFLWRLHFLKHISPESRGALLRRVAARTQSPEVHKLLVLLEQMHTEEVDLIDWEPFMQRAIPLFGGSHHWEKLDAALNQMAFTFLLPPTPEHFHAARTEFDAALRKPSTAISSYLFESTTYYFQHKERMPAWANLRTFRNSSADQIRQLPFQHPYFELWRGLSYNKASVVWLISQLLFVVVARRTNARTNGIAALGIAMTAVGLLIFAATSLLHDYEPRFALTMWQLLFLSLFLLWGRSADLLAIEGLKRPVRRS
ncbi:MAG TPA: hypothetical protein VK581_04845 [Chthoniobacterales bacterium]|nr:hypothetical protein [Chthoniobacterales bacterium]